jgi:hypothetical protein
MWSFNEMPGCIKKKPQLQAFAQAMRNNLIVIISTTYRIANHPLSGQSLVQNHKNGNTGR